MFAAQTLLRAPRHSSSDRVGISVRGDSDHVRFRASTPLDFSRPKGGPQDFAKNSKNHYRKPKFDVWITVRLVLSPATRGDGPLAAGCPRSYVNLQALRDPAPRILGSVGISKKWRIKSYVILHALRGPAPRFFDSVREFKNRRVKSYVNLRAVRAPILHFRERGGGSGNGPRLSLGNGTTPGPKVTCFTVDFLAGSHRSRAAAPKMRESSTGVADPGPPRGRRQSAR